MSEQSKIDGRSVFEAYMLGREHPVFGWITSNWFGRGDNQATYENDYVQGCWVMWQARASLPVGVPDGWAKEALRLFRAYGGACSKDAVAATGRIVNNGPLPQHWRKEFEKHLAMLAAPTVKAEQVPADGAALVAELRKAAGEIASAGHFGWGNAMTAAADALEAPSLPAAAGSARHAKHCLLLDPEEPEARCTCGLSAQQSAPAYGSYTTRPAEAVAGIALRQLGDESRWVEIRDLNSHAFPGIGPHDYYPVGTLLRMPAEQQYAPERVSVPVDLLERTTKHLRLHAEEASHPGQYALINELRALLASHAEGGKV